jgi:hypothetical protein
MVCCLRFQCYLRVAAARSNGSHHLCPLRDVSPTTPGASGAVVPWNYYSRVPLFPRSLQEEAMNGLIYLIGLIVVILAILSFFGLR